MKLDQDKLKIIKDTLIMQNIEAWLIVSRESMLNNEPILQVIGDLEFGTTTALVFSQTKVVVLTSSLDRALFEEMDHIDSVIVYENSIEATLCEFLQEQNYKSIALNYSLNDAACDGLTFGLYKMVNRILNKIDFKGEILSAFKIVSRVRGIKTDQQLKKITFCANKAHEYLMRVPEILHEGSTSLDIYNFLQKVAYDDGYTMAWSKSQCPGVSVDPNVPSGHMGIIETEIKKGYLINIDYGIAHEGYCCDLQRMYYVLKDDEDCAPAEAVYGFETIRDAICESAAMMKPNVTGYMVDRIARGKVVSNGFDSWNAALGHQVGHQAHDGGTILANRRERYNKPELIDTPLEVNNVFTLEPSLNVSQGRVGIEEMVVVKEDGAHFLVQPQQELILIRLGEKR